MLETTKLPRRSMSLYERVSKSDVEDKSLSNDETPLPSCPRQPPDGVETPNDIIESPNTLKKTPDLPSRLPPRLPAGWPGSRSRFSYSSRTQDARSEASVKDKIAMFSNDRATSIEQLDKCGTLPARHTSASKKSTVPYMRSYSDVLSLDRRLTKSQDNLDEMPRTYKRQTDRPDVLGAIENVSNISTFGITQNSQMTKTKPLFYGSTTTLPSTVDTSFAPNIYHARSVSDDNTKKTNISTHKSNLDYLIEQRKKSMSKLRGLVIPEAQGPIVDLPEIKVQDRISKTFVLKSDQNKAVNNNSNKTNTTKHIPLNDVQWKVNLLPNNLPKYSPAFKRKSLQVYTPSSLSKESTPERNFSETYSKPTSNLNLSHTLRRAVETNTITGYEIKSALTSKTLSNVGNLSQKDKKDIMNYARDYKNMEIKMCTATDVVDSDNDSAMSSTQSSYRSSASSPMHNIDNMESDNSRLSPRISHYSTFSLLRSEVSKKTKDSEKISNEYIKRNVCRSVSSDTNVSLSSSAGSAATSGSQASCSSLESSVADSDKRKVSKTYDIDTINRRNILASAKCRSGRDAKLKSPVIETKFSHESYDRPPSPVLKASDRLSTLTSNVSAVSNKGENRRRNKIIAETDSDSDNDANIRQRKIEYKNTRLKRNSSSSNKNKPNEINSESPKVEDAPKEISENIIKEIKKAGLVNYNISKQVVSTHRISSDLIKNNDVLLNGEQTTNKIKAQNNDQKKVENTSNSMKERPLINTSIKNETIVKKIDKSQESIKVATQIVRLQRGIGSGVGVILAGGIDCEAKDVTVHRVLADSVAAKAGLKRGVKICSINGCNMAGLTHAQSVAILKEQRSEVIIEIEKEIPEISHEVICGSEKAESKAQNNTMGKSENGKAAGAVVTVLLEKAGGGAGLGFGLDGGRDSPRGDCPLTIKKLFAGGAAAQCGSVLVGAELLSAGGQSMEGFTRTQAWAALKALPAGQVSLVLRNPKTI